MTNRHLESNVVVADGPQPAILPQVTYGLITIRMAIMALIMGGAAPAENAPGGRRT
mgnify:CR=1 FL=1